MAVGTLARWTMGAGQKLLGGLLQGKAGKAAEGSLKGAQAVMGKELSHLKSLHANGKMSDEAFETAKQGLSNTATYGAKGAQEAIESGKGKLGLMAVGTVAAGDFLINGKNGVVGGAIDTAYTEFGKYEADQNSAGKWQGFWRNIKELLSMIGLEFDYINNKVADHSQKDSSFTRFQDKITENGEASGLKVAGNIIGSPIAGLTNSVFGTDISGSEALLGATGITATLAAGKFIHNKFKTPDIGINQLKNTLPAGAVSPTPGPTSAWPKAAAPAGAVSPTAGNPSIVTASAANAVDDVATKSSMFRRAISGLSSLPGAKYLPWGIGAAATIYSTSAMGNDVQNAEEALSQPNLQENAPELQENLDASEAKLGGETLATAGATGASLVGFALASNPGGWAIAGIIGASVATGSAIKFAADHIEVGDKGKTLSEAAGEQLAETWSSAHDAVEEGYEKFTSLFNTEADPKAPVEKQTAELSYNNGPV